MRPKVVIELYVPEHVLVLARKEIRCSQCGQPLAAAGCGPTHAQLNLHPTLHRAFADWFTARAVESLKGGAA